MNALTAKKKDQCWAKGGGDEGNYPKENANFARKENTSKYALNASKGMSEMIILDSGCSDHMAGNLSHLTEVQDIAPIKIHMTDNSTQLATKKGNYLS